MKVIFLFSGQGSQYFQMGKKLMDTQPAFCNKMLELDEAAKAITGRSIIATLYDPRYKLFDPCLDLELTHPAILMVELAMAHLLQEAGLQPDYLAGFSLGEFAAATVAGVLSEQDALTAVIRQAQCIRQHCTPGGLLAILQSPDTYHQTTAIGHNSTLASLNAPAQYAVAGNTQQLNTVKQYLKEHDILHQELAVAYGFHSPAIDAARAAWQASWPAQPLRQPAIPVVSGINGQFIRQYETGYFWNVVRDTTHYIQAIQTLEQHTTPGEQNIYIDLGPAGTLANLVKYNISQQSASKGFPLMTPFQQEAKKLEELLSFHATHKPAAPHSTAAVKREQLAYVFPGQGSQRKGMGEELFAAYPAQTQKASELLGYSITDLCLDPANRNLNLTQYTQPALYVANALSYYKLRDETGILPDYVAGHSLGEYNALLAAEAFDFETGLRLVQKRGALMATMKDGGMAAVKGLSEETIKGVIDRHQLDEIDIANYNSLNQIVLSGSRDQINRSGPFFEAAGATLYFVLNVSGAFHSRYMQPARDEFAQYLQQFQFFPVKIPVVSNVEAAPYTNDKLRLLLADQLVKPVRWTDSIHFLLGKGDIQFKEVGPGDVLTKLVYGIQRDMKEPVQ